MKSVAVTPFPKLLVSRAESAVMLSVSVRAIDYLVQSGEISVRRVGGRVLIPVAELTRFANQDHTKAIVPVAA